MVSWVKPTDENLRQEYEIEYQKHIRPEFGDLFPTYADFVQAVNRASVVQLTRAKDAYIDNRSHTTNRDALLSLIRGYRSYPKHRNDQTVDQLIAVISGKTPGTMTMPIVLMFDDGTQRIMSGNTRLDIAFWYHTQVPVVMVPVSSTGLNENSDISMWESILRTVLDEGVDDPHIFKAIFLAGGPGSGKSTVARQLLGWTGLRTIDVDKFHDLFQAKQRAGTYDDFWRLAQIRSDAWLDGRLGIIFDGTGRNVDSVTRAKTRLESLGYDTAMIFVNTDLQTARQRVIDREKQTGRHVPDDMVVTSWKSAQQNLGLFQSLFNQQFFIVDNSSTPNTSSVERWVRRFLATPPRNPIALTWIRERGGRRR